MSYVYKILLNAEPDGQMDVMDYDLGDFDLTLLWNGRRIETGIPPSVRLYVDGSAPIPTDYVGGPISWPICSERLLNLIMPIVGTHIQVFPAPLFDFATKEPVPGYSIVNLTRLVPCLNLEKSVVGASEEDGKLTGVYEPVFDVKRISADFHLFRPEEWPYMIIASEVLLDRIRGHGVVGMAVQRCQCV